MALLISISEKMVLLLLISFIILTFLFLSFNFWLHYAFPQVTPGQKLSIFFHLLKSSLTGKDSYLIVKNGKIKQDYFLLKKKPTVSLVYVADYSAAVTQNSKNEIRKLEQGINYLPKGEVVILTFNLRLQHFNFGPGENEDPFQSKNAAESFTDFHARQLKAQKTRSQTRDAFEIYPGFHIFYQLENGDFEKSNFSKSIILTIAEYLIKNNLSGEANPLVNELIGKSVTKLWTSLIQKINLDEIYSAKESSPPNISVILSSINQSIFNQTFSMQTRPNSSRPQEKSDRSDEISHWEIPFGKVYLDNLWIPPEKCAALNSLYTKNMD